MNVRRIGIAGYMGAGKTAAARLLSRGNAAAVIDADYEAKMIMSGDASLQDLLAAEFGASIIESGRLSFRTLGAVVFTSKAKLMRLNEIVHPLLVQRLRSLLESPAGGSVIVDAAVLPLWKLESLLDTCLWINASFETRLERLKKTRRDLETGILRERMRVQEECLPVPPCPPWRKISNDGSIEELSDALRI
jgi:dephospho-CoA kinase